MLCGCASNSSSDSMSVSFNCSNEAVCLKLFVSAPLPGPVDCRDCTLNLTDLAGGCTGWGA